MNRQTYKKMPKDPAKPLEGNIVVKRVVQKVTKEQEEEKPKKDAKGREKPLEPVLLYNYTEIHDLGEYTDLPYKVGDKVNIISYGREVVTAEIESDIEDICFVILPPNQVIGVYK